MALVSVVVLVRPILCDGILINQICFRYLISDAGQNESRKLDSATALRSGERHESKFMKHPSSSKGFPTTLWTVVLHAGNDEPAQAQAALAKLCQDYWYPL